MLWENFEAIHDFIMGFRNHFVCTETWAKRLLGSEREECSRETPGEGDEGPGSFEGAAFIRWERLGLSLEEVEAWVWPLSNLNWDKGHGFEDDILLSGLKELALTRMKYVSDASVILGIRDQALTHLNFSFSPMVRSQYVFIVNLKVLCYLLLNLKICRECDTILFSSETLHSQTPCLSMKNGYEVESSKKNPVGWALA